MQRLSYQQPMYITKVNRNRGAFLGDSMALHRGNHCISRRQVTCKRKTLTIYNMQTKGLLYSL